MNIYYLNAIYVDYFATQSIFFVNTLQHKTFKTKYLYIQSTLINVLLSVQLTLLERVIYDLSLQFSNDLQFLFTGSYKYNHVTIFYRKS